MQEMERTLFDFDDEIDNLTEVSERYVPPKELPIKEEPVVIGSLERKLKPPVERR